MLKALCHKALRVPYTVYTVFFRHTHNILDKNTKKFEIRLTHTRARKIKMTPYKPYNPYKTYLKPL